MNERCSFRFHSTTFISGQRSLSVSFNLAVSVVRYIQTSLARDMMH